MPLRIWYRSGEKSYLHFRLRVLNFALPPPRPGLLVFTFCNRERQDQTLQFSVRYRYLSIGELKKLDILTMGWENEREGLDQICSRESETCKWEKGWKRKRKRIRSNIHQGAKGNPEGSGKRSPDGGGGMLASQYVRVT